MNKVKELCREIFSEYQEEPVPIDQWMRKTDKKSVLFAPERGFLMYNNRRAGWVVTTHIWLCGTVSKARNHGTMRCLLRSMLNDPNCLEVVSAHVNRVKFPEMVNYMNNLGFQPKGALPGKNLERFEISAAELRERLRP